MSGTTIALLASWIDGWYQTQLWRGALAASRLHGNRLLCLVGYAHPSNIAPSGPDGIGGLAARSDVDAVMLSAGPLTFWEGSKAIDQILSWMPSERPVVSLGQVRTEVPSIVPDGGGIAELVRHMVREHGCRRIAFLEGPPTNIDSARRLSDFLAACEELGASLDPRLREVGHFYLEGGEAAMEAILARGVEFDAVVCSNDAMAIGAARVLARQGLRVPQDIPLAGYDDCEESRIHQPPLTTVRSPTFQIGFRGVERCLEEIDRLPGLAKEEHHPTSLVLRKSCGCLNVATRQKSAGETTSLRALPTVSRMAELMQDDDPERKRRFLQDFLGTLNESKDGEFEDWQEILFSAARLALRDAGANRAAVEETILEVHALLAEARESSQSVRRLAMDGQVRQLHVTMNLLQSDLTFEGFVGRLAQALQAWCHESRLFLFRDDLVPKGRQDLSSCSFEGRWILRDGAASQVPSDEDILPPMDDSPGIWIGLPIEHSLNQFGVLLFKDWPHSESFVEHMRLVVSGYIQGVWRAEEERKRQQQLHFLSLHDPLTGLYNRRGLEEIGEAMVAMARREGRRMGVLMADLDGLKEINDEFGHGDGDLAIVALAGALRDCLRTSDTLARLGGDEFAAVFPMRTPTLEEELFDRIRQALGMRSAELARPWTARASLGLHVWDPQDRRTMSDVLAQADAELYRDKKRRKGDV